MNDLIKQGIDNCFLARKYEHPGYEENLCAGLRTGYGQGEPLEACKGCKLHYLYESEYGEEKIESKTVLLESKVKVNDTVYVIIRHKVRKCRIAKVVFSELILHNVCYCAKPMLSDYDITLFDENFGKTVFFSEKEAVKKLNGEM